MSKKTAMSNTKHTPGPWKLGPTVEKRMPSGLVRRTVHIYDPSHTQPKWSEGHPHPVIAECWWHPDEAEANARLIAAAVDLLEACEHAIERLRKLDEYRKTDSSASIGLIERAIAKATGGAI